MENSIKLIKKVFLSMLVILWITPSYAQTEDKEPVGKEVYETYKEEGVDKAIETYHNLKSESEDNYAFDEFQLNRIGYKIMNEDKDIQAAKEIFELNMKEYPNAVNPQDSYGDVLVRLGEKEEAKKYYKKAVEIFEEKDVSEQRVARGAKGKLASLENKHKELSFLEGTWKSKDTDWNEQNEEKKGSAEVSFTYVNDLVLVGEIKPEDMAENDIPGFVWIVAFDAQKEAYETAWIGPGLRGLSDNSKVKVERKKGGQYVLMEEYEEEDKTVTVKHEVQPRANEIKWVTYISENGEDFRKIAQHDMTKVDDDLVKK